jgi:hypothetical protein
MRVPLFAHSCYMPARLILLYFKTILSEEYITMSVMQFSPPSCYLIPFRSEYPPQHPIPKHPQSMCLPYCQRRSSAPIQNHRQNYSLEYSNF